MLHGEATIHALHDADASEAIIASAQCDSDDKAIIDSTNAAMSGIAKLH